ncbi:hypothetical protein FHR85_002306 [Alkalibacillus almallahensis]|nr:hypothetical protein [Alkalibacillus almallahensis]
MSNEELELKLLELEAKISQIVAELEELKTTSR